jgi:hypothetical protein
MSSRYAVSAHILAKWAKGTDYETDEVDIYPGQVQYYFVHSFYRGNEQITHYLAFVRWYRVAPKRFHFSVGENRSNVELWHSDFYPEGRDSILPVHLLLGRFVASAYKHKNETYVAISPLNRRYHL